MKKLISIILCAALLSSLFVIPICAVTGNPFADVPEDEFYYTPVLWAVANGITAGTAADKFSPDDPCTRAQVVTFLWRGEGKPEPTQTEHPFTDISAGEFYYKAVLWAVEEGITVGTAPDQFGPDDPCTRAQVVTFLWRAMGEPDPSSTSHPFTDVTAEDFYYKAMLWAVEEGITVGLTPTSFGPDATCTRSQIVTFIYRYMTSDNPLGIVFQPENYYMEISQENAEFSVTIQGGSAPYTYQWVTLYDTKEVKSDPVTSTSSIHVFTKEFSDYDFDDYRDIGVYCMITDSKGQSVESDLAMVFDKNTVPVSIVTQPENYYMEISQENAEFSVTIQGGYAPYTYQWVTLYDTEEVKSDPVTSTDSIHVFTKEFSDYDFDDYHNIGVYCLITDSVGQSVESDLAMVLDKDTKPVSIATQPEDYFMESSQEDAWFCIELTSGVAPYTYYWVICYDNTEVALEPVTQSSPVHTLSYEFSDYDFDAYNTIGVYCAVYDSKGQSVTSNMAEVHPYSSTPLSILLQPNDYRMQTSQEDAEFTVVIQGGIAPYYYQWVIVYDTREVKLDPIYTSSTVYAMNYEFTDYDFDDYRDIGVYCTITDSKGAVVTTDFAEVLSKAQ